MVNQKYVIDLTDRNNDTQSLIEKCYKYIDIDEKTIEDNKADIDDVVKSDWMNKMSTYNIKFYYDVFEYGAKVSEYDNIESITLNYSLMYFITGITISYRLRLPVLDPAKAKES